MLPLEPTDDLANPVFRDASSCSKWLSQLQLTNLTLAQGTLRTQIDEFNRFPLRGKVRLQTLEALRDTVATVQADLAKRLYGKKLPFTADEYTLLVMQCNLWQSLFKGYLRCLQGRETGDASLSSEAALLGQRCLQYVGLQIGEFLRVGYEPDGDTWQTLHAIYAHVEEQRLQNNPVVDRFSRSGLPVSCRTTYVRILLLHRARLLGLSRSQWHTVELWLDRWGDSYSIEPRCSMTREDAPPLAVDLTGTRGFIQIQRATSAPSMRYMAMVPLSKVIRIKTILLQQGQSPNQLDLGDELNSRDCLELLHRLHACWCETCGESLADEPRDAPIVHFFCGLENIYAHIARKPFKPPASSIVADKEAQRQIETFGRVLDATDRHNLAQLGFLAEEWLVEEDGLLHARLLRKTPVGERLGTSQIVCVHRPDASIYKVGVTALVNIARNGHLYIGLRYLPGIPQALTIRAGAFNNLQSGAAAALLLPEISNLRIPASLIIPRDWFHAGRIIELALSNNRKQVVTLGISVEKGNDFERVSLTLKE